MTRQIVVEIVGDDTKFGKATKDATTKAETFGSKLKGSIATGIGIGGGIKGFNLVSDAIDTAVGKLGEAHDAFLADQASQALLGQSLKNNIPNWDGNVKGAEDYAAAQARLGFADDDIRQSLGQLVGVTHDLSKAQELNSVAQDLARAKGIDLATAADIVTKAYQGNGKALKALGIDVGTAKTGGELLAATIKNVNGAAETFADTGAGKMQASNVAIGEAMEKVGGIADRVSQIAIPVLAGAFTTVVAILGNVWDAIQPVITAIAAKLTPLFQKLGPIAERIFGAIAKAVKDLQPVFEIVFAAIGTIVGTFVDIFSTEIDIVMNVLGTLGDVFKGVGDIVSAVFGAISGTIRTVMNTVIDIVNSIIRAINGISFHIDLGPVGKFGFDGLNLPLLPRMHQGGIVPGSPGSDVLTVLQAGETVTAVGKAPGQTVVINIESFIGSDSDIDRFANKVALRLLTAV